MRYRIPRYEEIKTLPNGRQVYIYDEDSIEDRKSQKNSRVKIIKRDIKEIIDQVKSDIKDGIEPAAVVGLILCTYERVGNESSASAGHFGASNIEKRHVKPAKDGYLIEYIAKSGVNQRKPVTDEMMVSELKRRCSKIKNNDRIFRCTPKQVNDYLKQFNITSKDIRTFAANKFMADALVSVPIEHTKTARNRVFKEKLKEVAEIIGHKPSTLKSMYLSDQLKRNYLDDGKVTKLKKGIK